MLVAQLSWNAGERATMRGILQQMVNGSIAVLIHPSVTTFEAYERDDLRRGVAYAAGGAVLSAGIGAIGVAIRLMIGAFGLAGRPSVAAAVSSAIGIGLLLYLVYLGIVFLIGRQFGGSGPLGALAYSISLFYTPLVAGNSVVGLLVAAAPALSPLAWLLSLAAFGYTLYLTYLAIQAGMRVRRERALFTVSAIALFAGLIAGVAVAAGQ